MTALLPFHGSGCLQVTAETQHCKAAAAFLPLGQSAPTLKLQLKTTVTLSPGTCINQCAAPRAPLGSAGAYAQCC